MSGSSSPQTQTTTNEPPAYMRPYLNEIPAMAESNYWNFQGAPVTPFSQETESALQAVTNRAQAGSPLNRAAQDYTTKTLQGGFMGSNPWLDQTFNRAQGAVTNAVQSNFATSGRNPRGADAAGFAADQYNGLAAQIYGGDYQAERARQQQLVPFASGLANQDYYDASQLAGVGAQREALEREYAMAPSNNLDAYIARLQGLPGSSVTQQIPTERNWLAGASSGASMGSMFGPWGMLGGAVLGGIYG